jgi:hypothetical protein
MVYFARIGEDGPIKIGKSVHLPARMKQHGDYYGAPLIVLGVVDGGIDIEREISVHRHPRLALGKA